MIKPRNYFLLMFFCCCAITACAQRSMGASIPATTIKKIDDLNASAADTYLADPGRARALAEEALLLAKRNNYRLGIGQSFLQMASAYWAQSYYPISLFYGNTALKYFTADDRQWLSTCYRVIGRDYVDLKNLKKGLLFINKAYMVAGNNAERREKAVSERSFAYLRLKDYKNALADVNEALKLSRQLGDSGEVAILYGRLSLIYFGQKNMELSATYADTTYHLSFLPDNKRLRATTWVMHSSIAYSNKKYDDGIKYAVQAIKLTDSIGVMEVSANAYRWLIRCYEGKNDKDKALFFQKQYVQVQDSLNNADKQKSLQLIQSYFALDSKLHDIEQMQQKSNMDGLYIKSQRSTIYALTFVVALLALSVYFLVSYSRQKTRLSKKIQEQNNQLIGKNTLIAGQAAELEEINALKDRLLTIIGHDLKVPLANLRNIVDLFDMGELSPEEVKAIMRDMDPAIKGAELTLANLVAWAGRLLKGTEINIMPVNLAAVISEKGFLFKSALSQKNINYIANVGAGDMALADQDQVRMVLRNLISNAIKFTAVNGTITIATHQYGNRVAISVKDTGRGMSPAQLENVFSTNHRFSAAGTQGEKGTGIGLLLCKQLIALNDGTITVTSGLGEGSTFLIDLPAATTGSP